MDRLEHTLKRITCAMIAERFRRENERHERRKQMADDLDRVTEKLKRAAGVAPRANASLEAEADKLIAREAEFEQRKKAAFAPHYAVLDNRNREMDQLEDALKVVSNADPLGGSGSAGEGGGQPSPPETPNTLQHAPIDRQTTFRAEAEQQIAAASDRGLWRAPQ